MGSSAFITGIQWIPVINALDPIGNALDPIGNALDPIGNALDPIGEGSIQPSGAPDGTLSPDLALFGPFPVMGQYCKPRISLLAHWPKQFSRAHARNDFHTFIRDLLILFHGFLRC